MKKSVKRSGSPRGKLSPAGVPMPDPTENPEKTSKHGMCLRSRSVKKKASAPPVITPPDSSVGPRSSEGMTLRSPEKKKKSPEKVPRLPDRRRRLSKKKEVGRYFLYNLARMIPAVGFTERERSLCSDYLIKRDYKFEETIQYEMDFIDQIRCGLLMQPQPRYIGKNFNHYRSKWDENAKVKEYVSKMIQMVLDDMKIRIKDRSYSNDPKEGIDNLVRSNWAHLLSFEVHQVLGAPTDPPETDDEEGFEIVEAFFFAPPLGPIIDHLNLPEWRIRKNYSEVIFCTEDILEF